MKTSVAALTQREIEHNAMSAALDERQKKREEERQKRSKTGKLILLLAKKKYFKLSFLESNI